MALVLMRSLLPLRVLTGKLMALFGMLLVVSSESMVAKALKIVALPQTSLKNLQKKSLWLKSSLEVPTLIITRSRPARNWIVSAKQLSD